MELRIIPIGNSAGVILPKALLRKYGLDTSCTLSVKEEEGGFSLEKGGSMEHRVLSGPFTGPFAALKISDDKLWGEGEMSANDYADSLRSGSSKNIDPWL